jgi:hypothetical protein
MRLREAAGRQDDKHSRFRCSPSCPAGPRNSRDRAAFKEGRAWSEDGRTTARALHVRHMRPLALRLVGRPDEGSESELTHRRSRHWRDNLGHKHKVHHVKPFEKGTVAQIDERFLTRYGARSARVRGTGRIPYREVLATVDGFWVLRFGFSDAVWKVPEQAHRHH